MPRGIPKSGVRMTKNRIAQMEAEKVNPMQIPSEFSVSERFKFIENFVEMVAAKNLNSFVLTGAGGIGKSYAVTNTLNNLGLTEIGIPDMESEIGEEPDGDYIVVKGFSTDKAFFRLLWENNGKIIVFDDIDNLLKSPVAMNIAKGALSDDEKRIISWNAEFNSSEDLPNRFQFTGRCIFISNMSITQFPQPLISRSFCVDLSLTNEEKLQRIADIFIQLDEDENIKVQVLQFLMENMNKLKDLNIRSALNTLKLAKFMNGDWKRIALYSGTV